MRARVSRPLSLGGWLLLAMLAVGFGPIASALATTAADLCAVSADPCNITTQQTITNESVLDFGNRALRVENGGALRIGSGEMTIRARLVTIDLGGSLNGAGTPTQPGGIIRVEATDDIIHNGTINVSGAPGGFLLLHADDQLQIGNTIVGDSLAEPNEPPADFVLEGRDIFITGGISGVGAGEDNAGGDITISATGSVEVGSLINLSGGEGGVISVFAGASVDAGGNFTLSSGGELRADGLNPGSGDGDISIDTTGDGIETGHVFLDGKISAIGRTGSFETGGGAGGCVDIAASGDLRGVATTGQPGSIIVEGGGPDGSGGLVSLDVSGELDLTFDIIAGSRGAQSEGGSVCIDVSGDANLSGSISVIAGDGGSGDVTVESDDGSVRVGAVIDANATSNGTGGAVCLASGGFSTDRASSVIANAAIRANGSGTGGGGAIELDGTDLVQIMAPVSVNGGSSGARGGTIIINASDGPAILQGALNGVGSGGGSAGGILTVDAEQRVTVSGPIDLSAQGGTGSICSIGGNSCQSEDDCSPPDICRARGGGLVDLRSTGPIDLNGPVRASSNGGGGGRVDLLSDADIRFGNSVVTDGSTEGGRVDALGCMVTVCGQNNPICPGGATGSLSSRGSGGTNRLVGRGRRAIGSSEIETSVVVLGSIVATAANQLVYTQGGQQPVVFGNASPPATRIPDSTLMPCPICGNGSTEPPEQCDDGNTNDGDGCSSICQMEEPVPGDANGDARVTADDVDDLVLEIFDGDGDSVATVSSSMGTFPGNPGADANQDRFINAADVTRTIILIGNGGGG